ncbi:MAG: hypothetical protein PWQ42_14 [Sulfurospirillum sp.]|jgi:hypothetical protein|nr:hypothetical protein [Sulfurospirillum sp.]
MIARLINAFLIGVGFVSIIDFLLFIGLKINYFDAYKIKEYFNTIFIDNQNFYLLLPLSLIVGYLLFYSQFSKLFMRVYLVVLCLSFLSIYEPIGKELGHQIFLEENLRFKVGETTFSADLLYKGRSKTYLYRKDIDKFVVLSNEELEYLTTF